MIYAYLNMDITAYYPKVIGLKKGQLVRIENHRNIDELFLPNGELVGSFNKGYLSYHTIKHCKLLNLVVNDNR